MYDDINIPKDTDNQNDFLRQSFNITQKQLDHILTINENKSEGLRQIIDKDMKNNKKSITPVIDRTIIITCFGIVIILINYLMDNIVQILCIAIGTLLIIYSVIGGIVSAIQFSKK